ncbi:hypothetical protein BHE74_00052374 [Ensete ventricosum]|nr:hypothetical protein GW17_00050653 [Ensete ventricosum]RWW42100.1 hypothetical protein BHE74_00052374 [Ensete ventricosum]
MHPLRFPNSGIRAKVFVWKIGFNLRMMRLNRVESFYAFFLRFRSEGNKEEGWPATASPHVGLATHGQAAAGCGQGQLAREVGAARKGGTCCSTLKGGRVYGVRKGLPPVASPTASRGGDVDRRGGHPLAGWLQVGKGNRHLRRGSSNSGADGARGARASF